MAEPSVTEASEGHEGCGEGSRVEPMANSGVGAEELARSLRRVRETECEVFFHLERRCPHGWMSSPRVLIFRIRKI